MRVSSTLNEIYGLILDHLVRIADPPPKTVSANSLIMPIMLNRLFNVLRHLAEIRSFWVHFQKRVILLRGRKAIVFIGLGHLGAVRARADP